MRSKGHQHGFQVEPDADIWLVLFECVSDEQPFVLL